MIKHMIWAEIEKRFKQLQVWMEVEKVLMTDNRIDIKRDDCDDKIADQNTNTRIWGGGFHEELALPESGLYLCEIGWSRLWNRRWLRD